MVGTVIAPELDRDGRLVGDQVHGHQHRRPITGSLCGGPTTQSIVVCRPPIWTVTGPATAPGHGPEGPVR